MAVSMPNLTVPKRSGNAVARSQAERLWLIGGGLVALLLILLGYLVFISPQRSRTSDVNSQVSDARRVNTTLQLHLDALRAQNKNLAKYEQELKSAQLALPSTAGISDFLRSLQSLGSTTSTDVTSLTVGQPTDVSTVASAPAAANPTASAAAAPATPAAPAAAVGAAKGPTIYALPITAQVSGAPSALNNFLQKLQTVQPRAVLITQVAETTGSTAPNGALPGRGGTTIQLTMQAFVAPTNPTEQASLSAASH